MTWNCPSRNRLSGPLPMAHGQPNTHLSTMTTIITPACLKLVSISSRQLILYRVTTINMSRKWMEWAEWAASLCMANSPFPGHVYCRHPVLGCHGQGVPSPGFLSPWGSYWQRASLASKPEQTFWLPQSSSSVAPLVSLEHRRKAVASSSSEKRNLNIWKKWRPAEVDILSRNQQLTNIDIGWWLS